MIFVSSPYTHTNKDIVNKRVEKTHNFVASLTHSGLITFSPIIYGHSLLQYREMPSDYKFWKNFCVSYLRLSEKVLVLMLDEDWEISEGVKDEIRIAEELLLPIEYIKF